MKKDKKKTIGIKVFRKIKKDKIIKSEEGGGVVERVRAAGKYSSTRIKRENISFDERSPASLIGYISRRTPSI